MPPRERPVGPGVFRNTVVNVLGLGAAHGMSALSGLITARALGSSGVGILAVSFGLVEFGRSLSNFTHNPSIIEYHRGTEPHKVFGTSLLLKLVGSTAFVAIAAALAPWLATVFNVPSWSIVLAAMALVIGSFYEIGTARFEADNRMIRRNVLLALGPFVGLLVVGGLAWAGRLTVLTSIMTTLLAVTIMSLSFMLDEPRLYLLRFDGKVARYLMGYGARIVLSTLLTSGLLWTDTLMVSALLGNEAAGIYNVVFQITYVLVTASLAIGIALMPALSELAGRGEDTTVGFQRGTFIALGMSCALALLFLVSGPFILGLYGPEFAEGYPTMAILLLFGIAAATAVPASSLLTVHGHAGWMTILSFCQLAANIPLNYVLIRAYGIQGAAIATTTIFMLGTLLLWMLVYRTRNALPLTWNIIGEALQEARQLLGGPR